MTDAPTYVYKPTWVANAFIQRAREEGVHDVDPLKIQKLVYNLHGWHLATTGVPAVGERFEAWPNGPVLSTLYQKFKKCRWNPVKEYAPDIDPQTGEEKPSVVARSDEQFYEIFGRVWNRYKHLSGPRLSALTHADDTPWSIARAEGQQYISDDNIRAHFLQLASQG